MFTTSGRYPWSFVIQIFHSGQPSHGGDRNVFEVMTSTLPKGTLGSVASLLAATLYQGNPDRNNNSLSNKYSLVMIDIIHSGTLDCFLMAMGTTETEIAQVVFMYTNK